MSETSLTPGKSLETDLRLIREARGLTREDIFNRVHIRPEVLKQVEDFGFKSTPTLNSDIHRRSFVKHYADAVGIEADFALKALEMSLAGTYDGSLAAAYLGKADSHAGGYSIVPDIEETEEPFMETRQRIIEDEAVETAADDLEFEVVPEPPDIPEFDLPRAAPPSPVDGDDEPDESPEKTIIFPILEPEDESDGREQDLTPESVDIADVSTADDWEPPAESDIDEVIDEEPVGEEPVGEAPIADEPAVEEPISAGPVTEESVIDEPVVEEPVTEEPTPGGPVVEEPVAGGPVVEEPTPGEPEPPVGESSEPPRIRRLPIQGEHSPYAPPMPGRVPPSKSSGGMQSEPQVPTEPDSPQEEHVEPARPSVPEQRSSAESAVIGRKRGGSTIPSSTLRQSVIGPPDEEDFGDEPFWVRLRGQHWLAWLGLIGVAAVILMFAGQSLFMSKRKPPPPRPRIHSLADMPTQFSGIVRLNAATDRFVTLQIAPDSASESGFQYKMWTHSAGSTFAETGIGSLNSDGTQVLLGEPYGVGGLFIMDNGSVRLRSVRRVRFPRWEFTGHVE